MSDESNIFTFFSNATKEHAQKNAPMPSFRTKPQEKTAEQTRPAQQHTAEIDYLRQKNIEEIRQRVQTPTAFSVQNNYDTPRTAPAVKSPTAFPNSRMREEGSPSSKPTAQQGSQAKLPSSSSIPDLSRTTVLDRPQKSSMIPDISIFWKKR
jgi:hypothetical protein